ncbi:DNA-binding protein [Gloeocapsa sp. PCC 73106]|uniref:helix-turn-helix domain-containing transcriptional regulator n=1 Tax=Gloeocapsa sp. PCC 73106 TaxID=102232 RepID=UPI0002AC1165|nr:transcriptional regulator [Gloeocapsa sp. PCC 73106]ELR99858.1 putative transcriptional regulator [Gloeocapsa sp. PCC 73106]
MPVKDYREDLLSRLADSNYASQYLKISWDEILQDGNTEAFLLALKNVVEAKSNVTDVANKAKFPSQHLHDLLNGKSNPTLDTLVLVLGAVGLTIDFKPALSDTADKSSWEIH